MNKNLEEQAAEDSAAIEEYKKIEGQHAFIKEKLQEIETDCVTFRDYRECEFDGVYDHYRIHEE